MDDSKLGKYLLTFLGGAALGAALGILLAPDKGVNTRRKISNATKDLKGGLADKLQAIINSAEDIIDDIKGATEDVVNEAEKESHIK